MGRRIAGREIVLWPSLRDGEEDRWKGDRPLAPRCAMGRRNAGREIVLCPLAARWGGGSLEGRSSSGPSLRDGEEDRFIWMERKIDLPPP
jgi:hypothetical protein